MVLTITEAYKILGVTAETSPEEIKKTYKKLALRTHPDKNPNDPEAHKKFLKVSEAYKRITDPSAFEDEEDALPNEEEMEAMFEMMFAEMMGVGGMGGVDISPEMFAAMEEMMMNGGEDDEVLAAMMFGGHGGDFDSSDEDDGGHYGDDEILEMLMHELMRPGKPKRGMKSSKSGKFSSDAKSSKSRKDAKMESKDSGDDSSDWETDSDTEGACREETKTSQSGKFGKNQSGKLKSPSMDRQGSFNLGRQSSFTMGNGSRRIPPRVSSGKFSTSPSSKNKSGKVKSENKEDERAAAEKLRSRSESSDEKVERAMRMRSEAKATSIASAAAANALQEAKLASQRSELVIGDRVLVQDKYDTCKCCHFGTSNAM
jgi:curved DNA-binding protein CbpA